MKLLKIKFFQYVVYQEGRISGDMKEMRIFNFSMGDKIGGTYNRSGTFSKFWA